MSDNYNANIYLITKDLNDIEDRIENITEECQEKIFGKNDSTYSGTNFQIETTAADSGELTKIDGQIEQETTQTGKNLFDITKGTNKNTTTIISGNAITITSTNTWARTEYIVNAIPNQVYTFNCNFRNNTGKVKVNFFDGDTDIGGPSSSTNASGTINKTFTPVNNTIKMQIYSNFSGDNVSVSATFENIQFEKGSQATSYEPYIPNSPSPDYPQSINITTGRQVVSVVGKNLFNKDNIVYGKSWNDTANANRARGDITNRPNENITISVKNISNLDFVRIVLTNDNFSANYVLHTFTSNDSYTLTPSTQPQLTRYEIEIQKTNISSTDLENVEIQIEKGNQATTYEEYKDTDYEINLGKNLLNLENLTTRTLNGITITRNEDGSVVINGTSTSATTFDIELPSLITFEKGFTYTSSQGTKTSQSSRYSLTLRQPNYYPITNSSMDSGTSSVSFTMSANEQMKYYRIFIPNGITLDNQVIYPMIEKGSVASSFSPYKTPIYLGKIGTYQDYIFRNTTESPYYNSDLDEGKWYIGKEIGRVVLDGSENYATGSLSGYYRFQTTLSISNKELPNEAILLSNNFKGISFNSRNTQTNETCFMSNGNLSFNTNVANSGSTFKTWLSTHPLEVYYVLIEPMFTQIVDEELINQLESIQLITGLNNINVSSSYLSGIITINKHFSNALRNIQVGDDLSGKTLYLSFPRTIYENIPDTDTATHMFIAIATNNTVVGICYRYYPNSNKAIGVRIKDNSSETGYIIKYLYSYSLITDNGNPYLNYVRFTLPLDYGVVTSIDTNSEFYQYVKIYDESIIPNYTKHTWVDNQPLTMQKIDNIEQGIKNIGHYYEKPNGWVREKEWLPNSNKNYAGNYGVGIKTISYQDLNRWYNNLDLIDFSDLNDITLWNAINDISQIEWNSDSDEEWVDNFIINVYELITEDDNTLITEDNNVIEVVTSERI